MLERDTDPNSYPLSASAVTSTSDGAAHCAAGGLCTYRPKAAFPGFDSLQYTVRDTHGNAASAPLYVRAPGFPLMTKERSAGSGHLGRFAGRKAGQFYIGQINVNVYPSLTSRHVSAHYQLRFKWAPSERPGAEPIVSFADTIGAHDRGLRFARATEHLALPDGDDFAVDLRHDSGCARGQQARFPFLVAPYGDGTFNAQALNPVSNDDWLKGENGVALAGPSHGC